MPDETIRSTPFSPFTILVRVWPILARFQTVTAASFAIVIGAGPVAAQEQPPEPPDTAAAGRSSAPLLYVDCRRCDHAHLRQEITFVNHVRDPLLAEIYVLITDQPTGGGGRMYTLQFEGREAFGDLSNRLEYAAPQTHTRSQERDELTSVLKLGLVPYAARTPLAPHLQILFDPPDGEVAQAPHDPWRNWTFEIYAGGNFNTETAQGSWNARYGFRAERVTHDWKLRLRTYFNNNARVIRREDEPEIRTDRIRHGVESFVIRSLGPHLGAGLFSDYRTSTIDNLAHGGVVNPAIEYSIFPYDEATWRQITFTYRAGVELANYIEETIYEQTSEALLTHALDAAVRIRQPWGSIFSSVTASNYLHNFDYHRISFDGDVSLRIAGGLALNFGASYQRINDQLALPRGDASLEDILLERRRLATSFRATGNIGLSYTFGSIFSNVVNPRF